MTAASMPTLAEQRLAIRLQLQAQRLSIASLLVPAAGGHYPRSMTMRLLINQPALLARLAGMAAGPRHARMLPVIVVLAQLLPAVLAAGQARSALESRRPLTG